MPILGAVVVFIQLCFAYHAVRTGRPTWWLFVIMGFPVMGCVLYYFIEVFPTTRESRSAERAVRSFVKSFDADKDLREKVADVEACGSVSNRISLARECTSRGMYEEAAALYRSCLTGINANDPDILHGLAEVFVLQSLHAEALPMIRQLMEQHPSFRAHEVRMLLAEALEGMGELDQALAEFRVVADTCPGEEGRWRYGALLKRLGRTDEALAVFQGMLKGAQRQPGHYRDAQRKWLDLAAENSR